MLLQERLIVDITSATVLKTIIDGMKLADKKEITLEELERTYERFSSKIMERNS